MKKKLALIVISLDECFTQKGFSGGGHKVTMHLILGLVESNKFNIDIFCQKGNMTEEISVDGINSVTVFNSKTFVKDLKERLKAENYDYILSSDILLPFANNLIHSNSSKYKSKNGKNKFLQMILELYNAKKIRKQNKNLTRDKAIFTVSESLKNDYVSNYNLDASKIFVAYPAVDTSVEFVIPSLKKEFVIGGMAGGGLNKGGYLLLFALRNFHKDRNLRAKIIFPKIHKAGFFKLIVKLLGLNKIVEILPKQKNMNEFYNTIDCYVLPSLNEAFGLVVTESALNFRPSIVSSTTGVSELLKDGENGFIFDRENNPVKNLTQKIIEVKNLYFNNNYKFIEISKNAHEITTKLDWQKFSDIIINNMIGEE